MLITFCVFALCWLFIFYLCVRASVRNKKEHQEFEKRIYFELQNNIDLEDRYNIFRRYCYGTHIFEGMVWDTLFDRQKAIHINEWIENYKQKKLFNP